MGWKIAEVGARDLERAEEGATNGERQNEKLIVINCHATNPRGSRGREVVKGKEGNEMVRWLCVLCITFLRCNVM